MTRTLAHTRWELNILLRNGEQLLLTMIIPLGLLVLVRSLAPVIATSVLAAMFTSLSWNNPATSSRTSRRQIAGIVHRSRAVTVFGRRTRCDPSVSARLACLAMAARHYCHCPRVHGLRGLGPLPGRRCAGRGSPCRGERSLHRSCRGRVSPTRRPYDAVDWPCHACAIGCSRAGLDQSLRLAHRRALRLGGGRSFAGEPTFQMGWLT